MNFNKISEKIILLPNSGGYFKNITISPNQNQKTLTDFDLLNSVINSPFHFWEGEKNPEGLTCHFQKKNGEKISLPNTKIFGNYDATKLNASHYLKQTEKDFIKLLNEALKEESENNLIFIEQVNNEINKNLKQIDSIYYLRPNEKFRNELISDFSIYSFFYAFILISKSMNTVSMIEFGLD